MKRILALFILLAVSALAADVPKLSPAEAARLVAAGSAVLVDVREPAEWAQTGVVTGAVLLPESDFDGQQKLWKEFLAKTGDRQLIFYCRTGHRAGIIAKKLAGAGRKTANAGGFKEWQEAGQPTHKPGVPSK